MEYSKGYLAIYMGPMYSGKSSKLIEIATSLGDMCLAVKPVIDNRYTTTSNIVSHDGVKYPCILLNKLSDLLDQDILENKNYIIIEEAQFFEDLFDTVCVLVEVLNKCVYVAGLDGDYNRKSFANDQLLKLIPFADEAKKMSGTRCGIAGCTFPTIFSKRTSKDTAQIVIGNEYIPVCRKHYLEPE